MGIFEVSEANRTAHCLELKAYDYMLRFERSFNGFETVGNAYAFLDLCCKACAVELAHTQAEIEAMPNGTELLSIYPENDIETYRDVLYFVGQVLGGFFCISREGKLELRKYGTEPVMEIKSRHRFTSSFSDFITRYTAVSSTNLRTDGGVLRPGAGRWADHEPNVINLIKNCVYNQQNILKNSVFLKKFCFFL